MRPQLSVNTGEGDGNSLIKRCNDKKPKDTTKDGNPPTA